MMVFWNDRRLSMFIKQRDNGNGEVCKHSRNITAVNNKTVELKLNFMCNIYIETGSNFDH